MIGFASLLAISAGQPAVLQGTDPAPIQKEQLVAPTWDQRAVELMNRGELEGASNIIEDRLRSAPKDVQARFLKGMIAVARKDNRQAISIFRSILIDQPKATRVRLELARAFYLVGDYGNALRQFQFALAGKPPAAVVANISRYMSAIRNAKSLSYNFGLAIAPDSNLNTGSSAREVTLFGLPFDLSEEAQQRSGVGLSIEAGGEWAPRIGKGKRLRLGVNGQRREYSGSNFDDMTIGLYAGPRVVAGQWDLSLLGTGYRRWYGATRYNQAVGVRAEATYQLSPRIGISAAGSAQSVTFQRDRERDAQLLALNASTYYALTSSSAATLKAGISRNKARIAPYSSWSEFVAAGYFRDLPMGFSVYFEPSYSLASYDEALPAFGRKRSDRTASALITLLNRQLVFTRFTPRVSYSYTRQSSSIPLYEFSRSRLEVGLTTAF